MDVSAAIVVAVFLVASVLAAFLVVARTDNARLRRRLIDASQELEHLERMFTKFAPAQVVEKVIARGAATSGERKQVTILFADLVAFTPLSESVAPDVLVKILNGYFQRSSQAITDHRGHVAKFIGDGVLAFFGALEPNPWQAADAVRAAVAMRGAIADYNADLAREGLPALQLSIGIHCGEAVSGVFGSNEFMEFSVIGRTVNLAARVEAATRNHGCDILITRPVADHLDGRADLVSYGPTQLRGIADEIEVLGVRALKG
jgi:adenylate cyclase